MLNKMRRNKKGFTLIELIIVVAIIAILAAVAVPNFMNARAEAKWGVVYSDAAAVVSAVNVYNAIHEGAITGDLTTEGAYTATVALALAEVSSITPAKVNALETAGIIVEGSGMYTVTPRASLSVTAAPY